MASLCVLPTAAGTGTGVNWSNALGQTYTPVRGNTYYYAGGLTYNARTFSTAPSSTTQIVLKKATSTDHVSDTGYLASYGTAQTLWHSQLDFQTGYWTLDGSYRNELDWFDSAAYGFKVDSTATEVQIRMRDVNQAVATNGTTVQYVWIAAIEGTLAGGTGGRAAIDTNTQTGGAVRSTGRVFRRMLITGSCNVFFLPDSDDTLIEYCATRDQVGDNANHGEVVNLYYCNRATVRYNNFRDAYTHPTLWHGTAVISLTETTGHRIYGNVFDAFTGSDAAIGYDAATNSSSDVLIYNNTFIDSNPSWQSGIILGPSTTNVARNNLWVNCGTPNFTSGLVVNGLVRSHNGYSGSSNGESNGQFNIPTSIFVGYSTHNLRLTGPTVSGTTIAAPFNTDMDGVTRGLDGVFDRGAFEFVAGGDVTPPAAPTGVTVS